MIVGSRYRMAKTRPQLALAKAFLLLQSSSFHLSNLLNHRAARVGRAGCVVMRLARFVREEPALAGCAHLVGNGGDGVRTDRTVHLLARCVGEGITTLASSGEGLVNRLLTAALRRTA